MPHNKLGILQELMNYYSRGLCEDVYKFRLQWGGSYANFTIMSLTTKIIKRINSWLCKLSPPKLIGGISFSPSKEDWILYCLLKEQQNGFYIDVGANHPDWGSVTKLFYERGWRGINIEPLPEKFSCLELKRKRDIKLNLQSHVQPCLATENGKVF